MLCFAGLPGQVVLHSRLPSCHSTGRAYSHQGRCLECFPRPGVAMAGDIEALSVPSGQHMAARYRVGIEAFLRFWTLLECLAKLMNTPAHLLLRAAGPTLDRQSLVEHDSSVRWQTLRIENEIISVAWKECARTIHAQTTFSNSDQARETAQKGKPLNGETESPETAEARVKSWDWQLIDSDFEGF
jgi:hypothetical protein